MIIIPERYEELNLNSIKKRLLLNIKNILSDDFYLLLDVNPTGGQMMTPFILLSKEEGLLCISIDEIETPNFESYIQVMRNVWKQQEDLLINKLLRERILKGEDSKLILKVNWVYFFANMSKPEGLPNNFYNNQCWFKDDFSFGTFEETVFKALNKSINEISSSSRKLNDDEFNNLGYVIAPHCYIPRHYILVDSKHQSGPLKSQVSNLGDRYVKAMMLDPEQINIVNDLEVGDQLLLACAGSGKSALLISKAFKLANLNPDKDVLITCYNNNLAQYYRWQIDVAGFAERNVRCRTFHALCQDVLIRNDIKIPYTSSSSTYHDDIFKLAESSLKNGKIKTRYDAIFIDEIQIFKREWYIFCFNLLKDKDPNNHMFVICGDKSQNVNNNIAKGMAPWQVSIEGFPEFEKNTIRIETNYRNCIEINDYINHFVSLVKNCFTTYNINISDQDDLFLRGQAKRPGNIPEVIVSDRYNEVQKTFETIEKLNKEYEVPYSDIAILIPQRQYRPIKYFILQWLLDEFNNSYMDRTLLLNNENSNEYTSYGERKGVCVSTIESALGLDFRAVIICGLYPMGLYEKSDTVDRLMATDISEEEKNIRNQSFFKNINQLYTGMTRARDYLYVLTSNKNSIYTKILLETRDRM